MVRPTFVTVSSAIFLLGQLAQVTATPLVPTYGDLDQTVLSGSYSSGKPSSQIVDSADRDDIIYAGQTPDDDATATAAPSWFTSTLMARRLLALAKTGVVSTIFPSDPPANSRTPPAVAGHSISLKEYISDCDEALPDGNGGDGNPTLLALRVATTFRNTAAGSNVSLSIDWWDHLNDTQPVFPGFPLSPAGLPRVTLFGYVEAFPTPVGKETAAALESCYVSAHPDAEVWLPGKPRSPHASYWAKLVVTEVYWIGGFGGLQQIGWMNATEWAGIRRTESLPGVGDGRGWQDVRLPGEKQ